MQLVVSCGCCCKQNVFETHNGMWLQFLDLEKTHVAWSGSNISDASAHS